MGLEQGPWQYSKKRERRKEKPRQKLERVWFDAQSGNPHTDVFVCACVCLCMCVCPCSCACVAMLMLAWAHIWMRGEMECKPCVFLLYCYSVIIAEPGDELSRSGTATRPYVCMCVCVSACVCMF